MPLQFVNYQGAPLNLDISSAPQQARNPGVALDSYHKGFRVKGIPPGALDEARGRHQKLAREAERAGCEAKAFDEAEWARNAPKKSVRAKPYSIPDAAQACADLARKAGWLQVEVVAIEKQAAKR